MIRFKINTKYVYLMSKEILGNYIDEIKYDNISIKDLPEILKRINSLHKWSNLLIDIELSDFIVIFLFKIYHSNTEWWNYNRKEIYSILKQNKFTKYHFGRIKKNLITLIDRSVTNENISN